MAPSAWLLVLLAGLGGLSRGACAGLFGGSKEERRSHVIPLNEGMLRDSLEEWVHDYAVMFYAPWCPHCKRFSPVWDQIGEDVSAPRGRQGDTVVGKFNCEQSDEASTFCQEVGISHYPTFMVFGYGDFHDHNILTNLFSRRSSPIPNSVKFNGSIYYEALRDWVKMMLGISGAYRFESRLKRWFGLKDSRDQGPAVKQLREEVRMLREENRRLQPGYASGAAAQGVVAEAAAEEVDSLVDPFFELDQVGWDPEFSAVMDCIADLGAAYCDLVKEAGGEQEPYCSILPTCAETFFAAEECRPHVCPFSEIGCEVISQCLYEDVLSEYMEAARVGGEVPQ